MANNRGKDLGYTLLEMLLVLILLAGAGFVLLIKLPMNLEKQQLAFETTQLLAEIRDTRQAALAENTWFEMKFYVLEGDHHYKIFRQGINRVKELHMKDGIEFVGQPSDFRFDAAGRSIGKMIVLTSPSGEQRRVIIAPVGMRIREE